MALRTERTLPKYYEEHCYITTCDDGPKAELPEAAQIYYEGIALPPDV